MSGRGIEEIGYFDCPGGGRVVVDGDVAFIAQMRAPDGTTLVDVSDPAWPRALATLAVPSGTHSHKVRAASGVMLVNREAQPAHRAEPGFEGGLGIYDVSNPHAPREIAFWRCGGAGVHRFTYILAQIIHECRQRRPDGCAGRAAPRGSRDHEVGGRASRGGWAPSCARGPVARSGNGSRRPSRGRSPCAPVRLHGNRS
jgi:hypothetical protein